MDLSPEEIALVESHRKSKAARRVDWRPVTMDEITPEMALAAYRKIHGMALSHMTGADTRGACFEDCDCKQYIFEAAMELLALPGDADRFWKAYNATRQ